MYDHSLNNIAWICIPRAFLLLKPIGHIRTLKTGTGGQKFTEVEYICIYLCVPLPKETKLNKYLHCYSVFLDL